MSVVQNPLIGQAKQKMGNAVFSTWKGINVLKTKPMSVANPRTGRQLQQRAAFAIMVALFRQLPGVVNVGFKKLAVKMSEFNAFTSVNLRNAFDLSAPPVAVLLPENLLISKGTIAPAELLTAVASKAADTIVVTWPTTPLQPGQAVSDLAIIAVYNETDGKAYGEVTEIVRSAGTGSINMPNDYVAGDVIQVYLGFYNAVDGKSSDSTTLPGVVVA